MAHNAFGALRQPSTENALAQFVGPIQQPAERDLTITDSLNISGGAAPAVTRQRETGTTAKTSRASTTTQFADTPLFEALTKTALGIPALRQQAAEIEGLKVVRDQILQTPTQTDLSPLLALVDNRFGAILLRGYQRRPNNSDAASKVSAQIRQAAEKLGNATIKGILAQRTGNVKEADALIKSAQDLFKKETGRAGKGALTAGQSLTATRAIENLLETRIAKITDETSDQFKELDGLDRAIQTRSIGQVNTLLSNVAKNIGADSGRLSDQDINRSFTMTWDRLKTQVLAFMKSNPDEAFSAKQMVALRALSAAARKGIAKANRDKLSKSQKRFSERNDLTRSGLTPQDVRDRFAPEFVEFDKQIGIGVSNLKAVGGSAKARQSEFDKIIEEAAKKKAAREKK